MKYVVLIPDGCADEAIPALGGKTPMQAAFMPNLDALACSGIVGQTSHCPLSLPPGSDACNLSLLGNDPVKVYSGRAPLEAAALGVTLQNGEWALRCNTVTIEEGIVKSFSAGNFSTEESAAILRDLAKPLAARVNEQIEFFPTVGYRNLMIWRGDNIPLSENTLTFPPHDFIGQRAEDFLPRGDGCEILRLLFEASAPILATHPINTARRAAGKLPCTHLWFWAQGQKPKLTPFVKQYGIARCAMIAAVDLLRGIALLLGWDNIRVPTATGDIHTDYAAKGRAAAEALRDYDLVCVHVEAPDEASHDGSVEEKITAMEKIDALTLPPIIDALRAHGAWRIFVSPDHLTPIATQTHAHGLVPWLIAGSDIAPSENQICSYDEVAAAQSPIVIPQGFELMKRFLNQ